MSFSVVGIILVVLAILTGLIFLIKSIFKKPQTSQQAVEVIDTTKSSVNLFDRNNKMLSEWSHTNETRDKMQLLEMSARAEED